MKMTELTVLRDDVEWKTRLDGKISGVEIDGRKISDIHDLACKVDYNTKVIKKIAWVGVAITLGIGAFTTQWIVSNNESIQQSLNSSKRTESYKKLSSLGYKWNGVGWSLEATRD